MNINIMISRDTGFKENQVTAVLDLLDQGSTVPFIARYRKERTGSLDEVAISDIRDRAKALNELAARKQAIIKSLEERQLYSKDLAQRIENADTMTRLEDVYEKYRPKRRTRAVIAREKGLEPLAQMILNPKPGIDLQKEAAGFIGPDVENPDAAWAGARDIIAEIINEDASIRSEIRELFINTALIHATVIKGKADDGAKFKDYFDWAEPAFKAPSHRILAMLRGAAEKILRVRVVPDEKKALNIIHGIYPGKIKGCPGSRAQILAAAEDAYKRLLSKSIENEALRMLKQKADEKAVAVFSDNLRQVLLSPPLGGRPVLAIDPGFRTGCKIACLDATGKLVHHDVIHPHTPNGNASASQRIPELVSRYNIRAVAVGNGTAGRETERFIRDLKLPEEVDVIMVDESGASIYSASKTAREEFPDHDITVRGAVSIGRRLMDPLAELVKVEPKSIGVGQYQHDVDQNLLQTALDDVVVSCVNQVGVAVNTASKQLLSRVSGLNAGIAANMVKYRDENGAFASRTEFLKVPRLGKKAFEQAAGFLRIQNGKNPLDRSGIHPESYPVVKQMAKDLGCRVEAMMTAKSPVQGMDLTPYVTQTTGLPTLKDIVAELAAPGRDPRQPFQAFSFDKNIHEIKDLVPDMVVPGIVTNVTAFGAFVDIGVHQDGLVHISQLADRFVKDPNEVVKVRQQVMVRVLEVDIPRKRISLSIKKR
ncbi:Tex family protein [Desulfobacter latus]|uniref:RNA-binding transcriptional accessory protein n=1 Tax=Desulfobacter latus TaxID=2292 RepID=A0A850SVT7_9BACT|nr:Tex family protein [Desulfobacter latus]NWH05269.1 RNA-binding transcriptional accessory protein [Desulfobacter latus]